MTEKQYEDEIAALKKRIERLENEVRALSANQLARDNREVGEAQNGFRLPFGLSF